MRYDQRMARKFPLKWSWMLQRPHAFRVLFCHKLEGGDLRDVAKEMGTSLGAAEEAHDRYMWQMLNKLHAKYDWGRLGASFLIGVPADIVARLAVSSPAELRIIRECSGENAVMSFAGEPRDNYLETKRLALQVELLAISRREYPPLDNRRPRVVRAYLGRGSDGRPKARVKATLA